MLPVSISRPLPFTTDFLVINFNLSWHDVRWAYNHGVIGWRIPVEIANIKSNSSSYNPVVIELENISKENAWRVGSLLDQLAADDQTGEEVSKQHWLYLSALWLFEYGSECWEKFKQLAEVYQDYGCPDVLRPFIYWLPSTDDFDPGEHTEEERISYLLERWRKYLDDTRSGNLAP